MVKYISFMDLLGTKATAISDPTQYREVIINFQKVLESLVKKYENIEMYVFSDCAYFESTDIKTLCLFLRKLRVNLLLQGICFSAAVCEGQLGTNLSYNSKRNRVMVDFRSDKVVKVYSLQSCFSGAGIYIDSELIKKEKAKNSLLPFIVKSVYQNFDKYKERYNFFSCLDIKFGRKSSNLLEYILNLYIKCYILDKKASRYYYTLYVTYITEQDIDSLLENNMFIIRKVVNIINRVSDNEDKLIMILLLINRLYDAQKEKLVEQNEMDLVNEELKEVFNYIFEYIKMDSLSNIKSIDSHILSDKNKFWLSKYCFEKY